MRVPEIYKDPVTDLVALLVIFPGNLSEGTGC